MMIGSDQGFFRSSGVQEFRSSGVQAREKQKIARTKG